MGIAETFVLALCLQGLGIATTNLLAKAIVTDSFSGQALIPKGLDVRH